jgi:hypothetical protein
MSVSATTVTSSRARYRALVVVIPSSPARTSAPGSGQQVPGYHHPRGADEPGHLGRC